MIIIQNLGLLNIIYENTIKNSVDQKGSNIQILLRHQCSSSLVDFKILLRVLLKMASKRKCAESVY